MAQLLPSISLRQSNCCRLKVENLRFLVNGPYTCNSFSAPTWRSRVPMIPAESHWWYNSVGDHFSSGLYADSFKEQLAAVGFAEDVLQWQISCLSTGEKQRLALLRGLCNTPSVLLLDEPCSSLDGYHTTLVEAFVLDYLHRNKASLLWVSHDPEQLQRLTDRELCMEKDVLIEEAVER